MVNAGMLVHSPLVSIIIHAHVYKFIHRSQLPYTLTQHPRSCGDFSFLSLILGGILRPSPKCPWGSMCWRRGYTKPLCRRCDPNKRRMNKTRVYMLGNVEAKDGGFSSRGHGSDAFKTDSFGVSVEKAHACRWAKTSLQNQDKSDSYLTKGLHLVVVLE